MPEQEPTQPAQEAPADDKAQDKTTDKAQATTPAAAENAETPAEHMIPKSRFDEVNEKLRKLEADAAKREQEQQKAEEERMAQDAEWQKLADQRKAKVDELSPRAELAEKLSAMVLEQYTAEIAEWPEQVKTMAPADDADVLTKLDWMKRAKPLAVELMEDKAPAPGNGRRPPPVSTAGTGKAADEQRTNYRERAARRYR